MAKELRKAIMNKSKAKNSYVKCPSRENFVTYKNAKTKCNYVIHYQKKKAKEKIFKEATKGRVMSKGNLLEDSKSFLNK